RGRDLKVTVKRAGEEQHGRVLVRCISGGSFGQPSLRMTDYLDDLGAWEKGLVKKVPPTRSHPLRLSSRSARTRLARAPVLPDLPALREAFPSSAGCGPTSRCSRSIRHRDRARNGLA